MQLVNLSSSSLLISAKVARGKITIDKIIKLNPKGIIINAIKQNSPASENNIQKKDVIISIGTSDINNIKDYKSALDTYDVGDTIMLRILRNNNPFYLAFEIK